LWYNATTMLLAFTSRQHRRRIIQQAVNTASCSWSWAKSSSETCWADWNH